MEAAMTAKRRELLNHEPIPLLNDIVFRYVFGEADSLPYLKAMLNAFFAYAGVPTVAELSLLARRLSPRAQGEKYVYLDIVAKDETGRLVEIGVRTYRQASLSERSLFYWSQLYSRQLYTPKEYDKLRPVICISLLPFTLTSGEKWYTIDRLLMTDHLQLHFIELPKLPAVVIADAEKWARFLAAEGRAPEAAAKLAASDEMLAEVHRRYEEFMSIDGKVLAAIAREKRFTYK